MTRVIVEREFEVPVDFDDIQELENRAAHGLQTHQVRFVRSFFSYDRRTMLCEYEAPDAESVRLAQIQAKMPFVRVWASEIIEPDERR